MLTLTFFSKTLHPGQDELDILHVGYLSEDINESDLFELFGLRTTNYLRDYSDAQIPLSDNTGKTRGFAYVKVPRHVSDELLKLYGIGFKGKMLVIEKTPPKAKGINGVNQNICPQMQPPQLDFDPENTVASRPLNGLKTPIEMLSSLKKAILHYFQTVYLEK